MRPCQRIFMALCNDLLTFTQCEMGTKLIKRQDFLIEVSAFFKLLTDPNYFFQTLIHFFSFITHTKSSKIVLLGELANSSPLAFN